MWLLALACRAPVDHVPTDTSTQPPPMTPSADTGTTPSVETSTPGDPRETLLTGFLAAYPLVFTERVLAAKPVDAFVWHQSRPTPALDHAPNPDVIYGIGLIDLRAEPAVLHATDLFDRYWSIQLSDLFVESVAYVGTRETGGHGGDWIIVPPGYAGDLPPGVPVIEATSTRMVALARLHVRSDADVPNVLALQPGYSLSPLSTWLGHSGPPMPDAPPVRGPQYETATNGVAFWDELGDILLASTPRAEEQALFDALLPFGVGPGLHPSEEITDPATLDLLEQVTVEGLAQILAETESYKNWIPELHAGRFDGDLLHRAAWCSDGWVTQEPIEAVYTRSRLFDGAKVLMLRMEPSQLPPAGAFWSVSVYDEDSHPIANAQERYSVQSTDPTLKFGPKGGVEIRFASTWPGGPPENWLPVDGSRLYNVFIRAYIPGESILDGTWRPPDLQAAPPP
ncbi:MAG: DUF1254 domain-containing protein [Alphaproteobacteria bacterium]|nr:DUF1254 domain-containing protein [Alphaproteobacteria bacterium]